ncbi:mechanosensitive ion channel family protein [Palleronia sp. KMU-117]|uniref:mechanosensitive ion channel family protein n=1 Tax=Palleronia sp. KMU-117 TaxID=3434108 RepID=UPI003D742EA3
MEETVDQIVAEIDTSLQFVRESGFELLMNVLGALAIIILALIVSGWTKRAISRTPQRIRHFDPTLASFFGNVAKYLILVIAAITVLGVFGIQTTSMAALIGAAGLAIGLALQGTLSHLAAGVMIVMFRPFKVGDFVEAAGEMGTVREISLFNTELATVDNVQVIVPNGDVFSSTIKNFSAHDTRRLDMVFGISYDSDLKRAEAILKDIVARDARVLPDPEPFIKLTNLGDYSVDFTLRLWCKAADYWDLKFDVTRAVKEEFDAGGIDIPFPTAIELTRAA